MNLSNRIVITSNIPLTPTDVIQPYGDHVALLPPEPDQITLARAFLDFLAGHQLAPRSVYFGDDSVSAHVTCDVAHEQESLAALRCGVASADGEFYPTSVPDGDVARIYYGRIGRGAGVHVALLVYRGEMP